MSRKFSVSAEKERALFERMEELGIEEDDLVERFIKASGPGGQKVNKSSSAVYLLHRPSKIEIKCTRSRSQAMNRFLARRDLCERLAAQISGEKTRAQMEAEKIRRQKRRRSRRQKEKMLEEKRRTSERKGLRGAVDSED